MKEQALPPDPKLTVLAPLLDMLPPIIARKQVKYFTGGLLTSKKVSNDDFLGKGPKVRVKVGSAVGYPKAHFLAYMESLGVNVIVPPSF